MFQKMSFPRALRQAVPLALVSLLVILLISPAATFVAAADAAHCSSTTESYCVPGGRDYKGVLNTTSSGLTCQAWSSQTPWPHTEMYPDAAAGIGDHNYCRYMDALQTVGCYTTDPLVQVDTCDIGDPCACPFPGKTITFTPPSGTSMVADGSTNFVMLQCFPSPCDLYYTINGDTPMLGSAIPYNGVGIMLSNNTMVKALAIYTDGTLNRFATYAVAPLYTPDPSLKFVPATDVVYHGPVLAHLDGVTATDKVLLFIGDGAPITYVQGDSFWVPNTSEVTAVINGTRTVTATYVIQSATPTFAVYPVSGSFLGGIRVVIYAEGARELYASVNGAAEESLSSSTVLVSDVGLNVVAIRAVYLGGVVSQSVHRYEIVESLPPTVSPSAAHFSRPITVTCTNPLGAALAVRTPRSDDDGDDDDASAVYALTLDEPGTYTVNCSYTDNIYQTHASTHVITLTAPPLPTPIPTPACGLAFPNVPLFLHAQVAPAADGLTRPETSYELSLLTNPAGGRVQFIEQLDALNFAYALVPAPAVNSVTVRLQSDSSDAMEADSAELSCVYPIYPLGGRQTGLHVARPICPTFVDTAGGVVPAECVQEIAFQLASCLHLYTTDLLDLHVYGPLLAMRVNQLPEVLEADMYQRVHTCLAGANGTTASVNVTDVRGEMENSILLATGWQLVDGISVAVTDSGATAPVQQSISDASFLVRVWGMNVANGSYYFVREDHTCFDLGTPASSALLLDDTYTAESAYASSINMVQAALAVFSIDVPGTYKLCARFGSAVYEVESFAPLTVTPRPWPTLAPVRASSCGGLVDTAFASTPLTVAFDAGPAMLSPLLSTYWYTVDGQTTWASKALGGGVSLSPVASYTSPSRVVVASLGPHAGVQATCVFYAPAVNPAVNRTGIHYRFYAKPATTARTADGATAVPAGNTTRDLVVVLTGAFQTTELMALTVASPIWAVPYSTNNVSDAVWIARGETRLSTSAALNLSLAVPHETLRVESSPNEDVWRVVVTLDGQAVTLEPSAVALSDLSVGMVNSTTCASGYRYASSCVCIGTQNKTAYLCGNPAPETPDIPDTSAWERVLMLLIYFALLALIGVYIAYSVITGERQHVADAESAEEIVVEDAFSAAPAAPPVAPRAAIERREVVPDSQATREGEDADVVAEDDGDAESRSAQSQEGSQDVEVNAANWF